MNLTNLMFKDIIDFCAGKGHDLVFIVKMIDYIFADMELNIENEKEVQVFIANMRIIANLYMLLGLTANFNDRYRDAYDPQYIGSMISEPSRLQGLKKFKLGLHQKLNSDLIPIFEQYRNERGI